MKDETLKEAFQGWEELSMTREEYFAYESRLKHIMDEYSRKREAEIREEKAKKEGLEEGKMKEKEESVSRLLDMGMEPKMIERAMELPLERIMEIKREKEL